MIKPKLIHYHFKLGKVESVVKVRRDSMSGPFKAGMDSKNYSIRTPYVLPTLPGYISNQVGTSVNKHSV